MRNLKFADFFHDQSIRDEINTIEGIEEIELDGLLGEVDSSFQCEEQRDSIAQVVSETILGYLIETRGEREVWDYLRMLDYTCVDVHAPSERLLPIRPISREALEEVPDVVDVISKLSVRDAANQLAILTPDKRYVEGHPFRAPGIVPFEFGKSMLELPFSYSEAELALQGVWDWVRFELPETPKELLLLGARTGEYVSGYAWRMWGRKDWPAPVLLFDDVTNEYLGNVRYFPDSYETPDPLVVAWDVRDKSINRQARLGREPNIIQVILRWSLEVSSGIRG